MLKRDKLDKINAKFQKKVEALSLRGGAYIHALGKIITAWEKEVKKLGIKPDEKIKTG